MYLFHESTAIFFKCIEKQKEKKKARKKESTIYEQNMNYHCERIFVMCNFSQVIDSHCYIFTPIDIHNWHRDTASSGGTVFEIKTYE